MLSFPFSSSIPYNSLRELLNCTFSGSASDDKYSRCSPVQSATFYRSFLDTDNSALDKVPVVSMTDSVKESYDKECPQDCKIDRYSGEVSKKTTISFFLLREID